MIFEVFLFQYYRYFLWYAIDSTFPLHDGGKVKKNFPPMGLPKGGKCDFLSPHSGGGSKICHKTFPPQICLKGGSKIWVPESKIICKCSEGTVQEVFRLGAPQAQKTCFLPSKTQSKTDFFGACGGLTLLPPFRRGKVFPKFGLLSPHYGGKGKSSKNFPPMVLPQGEVFANFPPMVLRKGGKTFPLQFFSSPLQILTSPPTKGGSGNYAVVTPKYWGIGSQSAILRVVFDAHQSPSL